MENELFVVTWLCKYSKKVKTFTWDEYYDDVMNKRMVFTNLDTGVTLTVYGDSYAWMITRPHDITTGLN